MLSPHPLDEDNMFAGLQQESFSHVMASMIAQQRMMEMIMELLNLPSVQEVIKKPEVQEELKEVHKKKTKPTPKPIEESKEEEKPAPKPKKKPKKKKAVIENGSNVQSEGVMQVVTNNKRSYVMREA